MKPFRFISIILLLASFGCTRTPEASLPEGLSVEEYPLKRAPEAESNELNFADPAQADPRLLHADELSESFNWDDWACPHADGNIYLTMCSTLGTDILGAGEEYDNPEEGHVILTRNGEEIYRISVGHASPVNGLRGLWVYDDHWALETAYVTLDAEDFVTGQITVDGNLLNEQYGYEEAFGFQTIASKPFYFYQKDGKIHANYAGTDITLGYDEILHYGCCSASSLNPWIYKNMVDFFGRKGETWYFAEIGVFDQP